MYKKGVKHCRKFFPQVKCRTPATCAAKRSPFNSRTTSICSTTTTTNRTSAAPAVAPSKNCRRCTTTSASTAARSRSSARRAVRLPPDILVKDSIHSFFMLVVLQRNASGNASPIWCTDAFTPAWCPTSARRATNRFATRCRSARTNARPSRRARWSGRRETCCSDSSRVRCLVRPSTVRRGSCMWTIKHQRHQTFKWVVWRRRKSLVRRGMSRNPRMTCINRSRTNRWTNCWPSIVTKLELETAATWRRTRELVDWTPKYRRRPTSSNTCVCMPCHRWMTRIPEASGRLTIVRSISICLEMNRIEQYTNCYLFNPKQSFSYSHVILLIIFSIGFNYTWWTILIASQYSKLD